MHPAWTVALWVVFVFVVWTFGGAESQTPTKIQQCVKSDEDREHIRNIMQQAVDVAMKEQIQHLFDIWMRDGSDQPKRAVTGFRNALAAYNGAHTAIANWSPPPCKP